jgi:hypothetical protein
MKPAALQAAEAAMWKAIRLVSAGEDASFALARFVGEYDIMYESWEDRADFVHDREWFQLACRYQLVDLLPLPDVPLESGPPSKSISGKSREAAAANAPVHLGESSNVPQAHQQAVAINAPQYIVPADLHQQGPAPGQTSDNIWSSINLSEGFNVTLPGTQQLTQEAATVALNIFDLSQCTEGQETPSPFQRLLTPHPESPGRLTQAQMADFSSHITSNLMSTPTSSPPRPELIENVMAAWSEPLPEQMENTESDLTQRFEAASITPSPPRTHVRNPEVVQTALAAETEIQADVP